MSLFYSLEGVQPATLFARIKSLKDLKSKLSKNKKKEQVKDILEDDFDPFVSLKSLLKNEDPESEFHCESKLKCPRKRKHSVNNKDDLIVTKLKEETITLEKKLKMTEENNSVLCKKLKSMSPRKVKQKIKRKDSRIAKLKAKLKSASKEAFKVSRATQRIAAKYCKRKVTVSKHSQAIQCSPLVVSAGIQHNTNNTELKKMSEKVAYLENELELQKDKYNKLIADIALPISTRTSERGKPFTSQVRRTVYEYLSAGVPANKIPKLIRTTLRTLADKEIDMLPSASTSADMLVELGSVSRQQLLEVLNKRPMGLDALLI